MGYDPLQLHQEIRQDHAQRRCHSGVGIHPAMTPIGGINPAWYHVANAFSLFVNDRAMPNNEEIKVISNYDR